MLGALEPERAPQLLGFAAAEPRRHHRHAQQLLLEQRHPQRALEDRLQRRMRICHGFLPLSPLQVGMHHLPDDRTRANQRHFDDQVVELFGTEARQRRHLRARFDLEHADRVGLAQHLVDRRIVLRQVREIENGRTPHV